MMFGDMGHGSLLLMVGIYLTLKGGGEEAGMGGMVRYIFLLMGIFAVYCGFIYNEFFALPLNLFSSCYMVDVESPTYKAAVLEEYRIPDMAPRSLWHPS